ncbi:MAG TPA: RNA-binding S4 domain-containing protein [Burkholderiales bacterium]|nr:RNA-binding S4 domain-containing protein [Burkholderiales bacterium]
MDDSNEPVRVDKWLWAARFFRTRSIAAAAIEGGKVQVNGERVKPAKPLKPGDRVHVRSGQFIWDITVLALSQRRGRAVEAQKLYQESPDSRKAREDRATVLKAERQSAPQVKGRPTKRDRRQLARIKHGQT